MIPYSRTDIKRQQARRELVRQYVRLQRQLLEANPSSSAYQHVVHAFRQLGYVLITSGFEDDLDRLLRIRVLDGGRLRPAPVEEREFPDGLQLIERCDLG
jgi:hypothetical protein